VVDVVSVLLSALRAPADERVVFHTGYVKRVAEISPRTLW
jgi:hypothetical protein